MGKLNTTASNIEVVTNQVTIADSPTVWTSGKYPSARATRLIFESLAEKYAPVGTIIETTDAAWNPNNSDINLSGSGEWELIYSGQICEYVGNQVLYPGIYSSGQITKTNLVGAYDYSLFANLATPFEKAGYHVEFRVSTVITTTGDRSVEVFFNNLKLISKSTWSDDAYRVSHISKRFKLSDIDLEATLTYTRDGVNLEYDTTKTTSANNTGPWRLGDICVHLYVVSDFPIYKWRRVT